jgi:hypothetical protein
VVISAIAAGPLALWKLLVLCCLNSITVTWEAGTVTPDCAIGVRDSLCAPTVMGIPSVVLPGLICRGMAARASLFSRVTVCRIVQKSAVQSLEFSPIGS